MLYIYFLLSAYPVSTRVLLLNNAQPRLGSSHSGSWLLRGGFALRRLSLSLCSHTLYSFVCLYRWTKVCVCVCAPVSQSLGIFSISISLVNITIRITLALLWDYPPSLLFHLEYTGYIFFKLRPLPSKKLQASIRVIINRGH